MRKGWALLHVTEVVWEERHCQPATPQEVPEETLEEAFAGWGAPRREPLSPLLASHSVISLAPSRPWGGSGEIAITSTIHGEVQFSSVQLLTHVQLLRPHGLQYQASLSITNSWSLPKLMSIE